MSSLYLSAFVRNARLTEERMAAAAAQGPLRLEQALTFCRAYRTQGIGMWLLLCDMDVFKECLRKSGRAFLQFLHTAGPLKRLTSRCEPFFDALAALDFETAREIALAAPQTQQTGREYAEDFLYAHFLMRRFSPSSSTQEDLALLKRYEQSLHDSRDERLDICKALLDRDERAFDDALEEWLIARDRKLGRLREAGALSPEYWATEGQVSIEGTALVALAEHQGLKVRQNYPFIPPVVRAPW